MLLFQCVLLLLCSACRYLDLHLNRMRIKVTRDSVIDKLNPLEKSPKHKKLPPVLRSKTPDKARRSDIISPRERKDSFVSPKRTRSKVQAVPKKKSKARAINLIKVFNEAKGSTKEEVLSEPLISPEFSPLEKANSDSHVSLVSMKTEVEEGQMSTPPPLKIKRSWKKHLPSFTSGYKLFTPDSPAKAAASPHNLAVKLCFLGRLNDNPLNSRLAIITIRIINMFSKYISSYIINRYPPYLKLNIDLH